MSGKRKHRREWTEAEIKAMLDRDRSEPHSRVMVELAGPRNLPEIADRLRRVPGIVFTEGPTGQTARLAGTRIPIFEIIHDYLDYGENRENLAMVWDWLTPEQLDTAIAYYEVYPDEIDDRIALDEAFARVFDRPNS